MFGLGPVSFQSGVENQKWAAKVGADRRDAPRFRRVARRWGRLCRSSGSFQRNNPTGFIPEQHQRDSAATTQRMEQASPPPPPNSF